MPGVTVADYFTTLATEGGIVEEVLQGEEIRSPSVQLRITPLGQVELLSTHDQILGGESGQVFLGSRFPADSGYAALISSEACKVGERLSEHGVIGRFAVDFVVARRKGGAWRSHAIELNLRKGGTTHPFLTLQFLTDGTYHPDTGLFTAPGGAPKFYVASDHVDAPGLRAFTPHDVLDIALMRGLHFDQARQVGSIFYMLSALPEHGRLGVTSVGDSPPRFHMPQMNVSSTICRVVKCSAIASHAAWFCLARKFVTSSAHQIAAFSRSVNKSLSRQSSPVSRSICESVSPRARPSSTL